MIQKIPLKYGLLTALGLIAFVLLTHALISNPDSPVIKFGGPVFFNVLHFIMIFLGIKAMERERGEKLFFKDALKTGVSIAFVFALTATVFFICVVLAIGTRWMGAEPGAAATPTWIVMVQAFDRALDQQLSNTQLSSGARQSIQTQRTKLAAISLPEDLDQATRQNIIRAIDESFVFGFRLVMAIGATLALGGAVTAFVLIGDRGKG